MTQATIIKTLLITATLRDKNHIQAELPYNTDKKDVAEMIGSDLIIKNHLDVTMIAVQAQTRSTEGNWSVIPNTGWVWDVQQDSKWIRFAAKTPNVASFDIAIKATSAPRRTPITTPAPKTKEDTTMPKSNAATIQNEQILSALNSLNGVILNLAKRTQVLESKPAAPKARVATVIPSATVAAVVPDAKTITLKSWVGKDAMVSYVDTTSEVIGKVWGAGESGTTLVWSKVNDLSDAVTSRTLSAINPAVDGVEGVIMFGVGVAGTAIQVGAVAANALLNGAEVIIPEAAKATKGLLNGAVGILDAFFGSRK